MKTHQDIYRPCGHHTDDPDPKMRRNSGRRPYNIQQYGRCLEIAYCEKPFHGKHGVLIHLGQVQGRKNHPEEYPDELDPDDFTIVHLDEHDNIVERVEEGLELSTTEERESERDDGELPQRVVEYLARLREEGKIEEAEQAEEMLLG